MELVRPEFVPDPALTSEEMNTLQHRIAETAVFSDEFSFDKDLEDVTVAGVDQAFLDDTVISGVVAMENGAVVEKVHAVEQTEIPYIPGLLAFREGNAIITALQELDEDPDILIVDGSGRIHFREAGIATHIGVLFDAPAVGVAKKLLCGEITGTVEGLEQGTRVPVEADSRVETAAPGTVIGYAFQSKQYPGKRKVNPLYVSPGHRISAGTAVDIVSHTGGDYKLPEPTRLADAYVDDVKKRVSNTDQTGLEDF